MSDALKAREALAPLVALAAAYFRDGRRDDYPDDTAVWGFNDVTLTAGDLRRAVSALAALSALDQPSGVRVSEALKFLDHEIAFYGKADGALDGIPFEHVAHVMKVVRDRLSAIDLSALVPDEVAGVEPVAWRTRGMNVVSRWMPWTMIEKVWAERWREDPSYKSGRREVEPLYSASALTALAARTEKAERERDLARLALERDRSKVIEACNAFNDAYKRRSWLLESRGPYEWDDDRYRDEFNQAYDELSKPIAVLTAIGKDWSNCPTDHEQIMRARLDWEARINVLEAELSRVNRLLQTSVDEFAALRDTSATEIAALRARLEEAGKVIEPFAELALPQHCRAFMQLLVCPDGDTVKGDYAPSIRAARRFLEEAK